MAGFPQSQHFIAAGCLFIQFWWPLYSVSSETLRFDRYQDRDLSRLQNFKDVETETQRDLKIWRMSRPRPTETHQKVLRPRPRVSLLTDRASFWGKVCCEKNCHLGRVYYDFVKYSTLRCLEVVCNVVVVCLDLLLSNTYLEVWIMDKSALLSN